ncbi:MAG: hypothetical protein IR164_09120 [Devosia sp.]|jgi:hypothetical protein|uniref:hypothetical protein n=1 Tax=unclassified Devosia TaxID=196773 RepID=UPI0019E56BA5|nr:MULTISPECIES: hypothetical protein [unclassified Devosia]MBF0679084.1 hypothetical protein [Devosia sp.]WEJ33699.1 hypothetical protein NYQ88_02405 [Devosia sp. SD17-2]
MPDYETDRPGMPVPLTITLERPSLARSAPSAAFVSQLLAERDRLPPQRERRTASLDRALGAYAQGGRITQRRMPQGFRKMVMA